MEIWHWQLRARGCCNLNLKKNVSVYTYILIIYYIFLKKPKTTRLPTC